MRDRHSRRGPSVRDTRLGVRSTDAVLPAHQCVGSDADLPQTATDNRSQVQQAVNPAQLGINISLDYLSWHRNDTAEHGSAGAQLSVACNLRTRLPSVEPREWPPQRAAAHRTDSIEFPRCTDHVQRFRLPLGGAHRATRCEQL